MTRRSVIGGSRPPTGGLPGGGLAARAHAAPPPARRLGINHVVCVVLLRQSMSMPFQLFSDPSWCPRQLTRSRPGQQLGAGDSWTWPRRLHGRLSHYGRRNQLDRSGSIWCRGRRVRAQQASIIPPGGGDRLTALPVATSSISPDVPGYGPSRRNGVDADRQTPRQGLSGSYLRNQTLGEQSQCLGAGAGGSRWGARPVATTHDGMPGPGR